jgi:hypothetical protein
VLLAFAGREPQIAGIPPIPTVPGFIPACFLKSGASHFFALR